MDRAPENQQSPPGPPPVNEAPLRLGWGAFWIALAAMAAGVVFIGWAVWAKDQWLREHLLGQAHQLGQTISASNLQKLTGQPGDIGRPEYRRLKSQLMAAQQINPLWQWVYLLGRNADGEFYFQLDSVAADTAEVSPPGQLYPEAPPNCASYMSKASPIPGVRRVTAGALGSAPWCQSKTRVPAK
jgi:hypothetical protein